MRYSFTTTKPCNECGAAIASRAMSAHLRSHDFTGRIRYEPGGCWIWTGSTTQRGYGQLNVLGRRTRAHRHVYEVMVGPIPKGMTLDHL